MKLRTISRVMVIALVVVVGGIILLHSRFASPTSSDALTAGTAFSQPAPAFQLTDQTGAAMSLRDLRGRVVVLTFVDVSCGAECAGAFAPFDAIARDLGPQARNVVWLAITVNPNNTPAEATQFIDGQHVAFDPHVLLGDQNQLAPIWQAYGIEVNSAPASVTHTDATYLIDEQGVERELLRQPIDAAAAAHDLRTLLAVGQ